MINQDYTVTTSEISEQIYTPDSTATQEYDKRVQDFMNYAYGNEFSSIYIEKLNEYVTYLQNVTSKKHKVTTVREGFIRVEIDEPPRETSTAETPEPTEFQNKINGNTYANTDAVIEAADFSDKPAANQQPAYDYTPEPPVHFDELPSVHSGTQTEFVPRTDKKTSAFKTISLKELKQKDFSANWQIEGFIERGDLGMIYGKSASSKSFFVQGACFCVAAGLPFQGMSAHIERVSSIRNLIYVSHRFTKKP
jgi:hypothetical protein